MTITDRGTPDTVTGLRPATPTTSGARAGRTDVADQAVLNLDGVDLCDECGRPPGYLAGPTADLPVGSCCGRPIHGACYPPKILGFAVVCEDGETRHPGLFTTRHDADRWAAWGHLCTARHTIRAVTQACEELDRA